MALVQNWEHDLSSDRVTLLRELRAWIVDRSERHELTDLQASQLRSGYHSSYLGRQERKEPCMNCTHVGGLAPADGRDRIAR
jgi:hypothetical protein